MFKICCAAVTKSFREIKHLVGISVPVSELKLNYAAMDGMILRGELGRIGGELLVLGFRWQAVMGLGVIDDFAEQLLA